jgi:phage-related protein
MPYNNSVEMVQRGYVMFEIIFYEVSDEDKPVEYFLDSLEPKMRAKLIGILQILQEKGNELREPYTKHLNDGIFEVRAKVGSNITRTLFFFMVGKKIVLTNGFVKKSQKTPLREIEIAKERRADYLERVDENENTK